jgi:hypothetical protein
LQEIVVFHPKRSSEEVAHNSLIKDSVRATAMPVIVEAFRSIIVGFSESQPAIVKVRKRMQMTID